MGSTNILNLIFFSCFTARVNDYIHRPTCVIPYFYTGGPWGHRDVGGPTPARSMPMSLA